MLEGLDILVKASNEEARLSAVGAPRWEASHMGHLASCLRVVDYFEQHPELLDRPIETMFVPGLPRTGTTLRRRAVTAGDVVKYARRSRWRLRGRRWLQRGRLAIYCGVIRRTDLDTEALGLTGPMAGKEQDPVLELDNPEQTDGAYIGPSRGHLFPRWARYIGTPRAYGYGASMGAWILDYLSGWAGEWGQLIHSNGSYRGPAFTGDVTIMTAKVIDKQVDEEGRAIIQIDVRMANQLGTVMATAKAEIELPKQ